VISVAVSQGGGTVYITSICVILACITATIVIGVLAGRRPRLLITPGSAGEYVRKYVRGLPEGYMAVNVASEMRVHRRERLTVTIGIAEKEEVIAAIGEARGNILVDQIKVGAMMRVEVTGDAFQIEYPERLDKIVIEEEPAVWDYSVMPIRRGIQTLTIRGIVRIRLWSGDQEYYELPVLVQHVRIRINASHTAKQCLRVAINRFVAAAIFVWGLAVALIAYALKLDSVKDVFSNLVKPFVAFH